MANRRERFKRLYPKRLKNAVWSIHSIGKLSERTNYSYKEEEVDEILSTLMWALKSTIIKFGFGSYSSSKVEQRFERLMDIDLEQLKNLKITDPELYQYILQRNTEGTSLVEEYLKNKNSRDSSAMDGLKKAYEEQQEIIAESEKRSREKVYAMKMDLEKKIYAHEAQNKILKERLEQKIQRDERDAVHELEMDRLRHEILDMQRAIDGIQKNS